MGFQAKLGTSFVANAARLWSNENGLNCTFGGITATSSFLLKPDAKRIRKRFKNFHAQGRSPGRAVTEQMNPRMEGKNYSVAFTINSSSQDLKVRIILYSKETTETFSGPIIKMPHSSISSSFNS